uniref:Uncharacterized protein n=1 Tax=Canis lupus dingo TaxID=286419 RepID=A0A8C0KQS6_CANLU
MQPFCCPFLLFPRGALLTAHHPPKQGPCFLVQASFVPHGAGHRAPVGSVSCAHPIPKRSQEASPP